MFPYPSAEGLHIGNIFAFTGADVLRPLTGGCAARPCSSRSASTRSASTRENYALKVQTNPNDLIPRNVANFTRQLKRIGGMFDWSHVLSTRRSPATTSGRSGFSCSSTRRDSSSGRRRRSTGVRRARQCSRTSRLSPGCASAATRRSSNGVSCSGSSRSAYYAGALARQHRRHHRLVRRRRRRRRRTGSAAAKGAEIDFTVDRRATVRVTRRSRRGPTRCSARRTWCSRPSIRWSMRLTSAQQREAVRYVIAMRVAKRDLVDRSKVEKRRPASSPAAIA